MGNFAEEHAHVEERLGELQEVGLEEDEVSRGQFAICNFMRCHQEVQSEAADVDHLLTDIEVAERLLHVEHTLLDALEDATVLAVLKLLICKGLHSLVVHDGLVQGKFCTLLSVLPGFYLDSAVLCEGVAVVSVKAECGQS